MSQVAACSVPELAEEYIIRGENPCLRRSIRATASTVMDGDQILRGSLPSGRKIGLGGKHFLAEKILSYTIFFMHCNMLFLGFRF